MRHFSCLHPDLLPAKACGHAMRMPALAIVVMAMGCGRSDHAPVYPAEGQVFWSGKPLAGAQVVLYPRGTSEADAVAARARTDLEGRFRLSTYGAADGAAEGEYLVTVVQYQPRQQDGGWVPGPNVLPAKYASAKTTDLRVQIAKGANALPPLVLQR